MTGRIELFGDPKKPIRVEEDPDAVDHPMLAFFLALWRERCGSFGVPLRTAFGPKDFGGRLPWLVLVEALPDGSDFRYRVIGARTGQYFFGCEAGKTVREAFSATDPAMGHFIRWVLRKACSTRKPVRLSGPAFALNDVYCPEYDTLYLPLSSDGTRCDFVLDALAFDPAELAGSREAKYRLSRAVG